MNCCYVVLILSLLITFETALIKTSAYADSQGIDINFVCENPFKQILVRSVNLKGSWPEYSARSAGIINSFYNHSNYPVGVTGIQEAKKLVCLCPIGTGSCTPSDCYSTGIVPRQINNNCWSTGVDCYSRIVERIYKSDSTFYTPDVKKVLGIVTGELWQIVGYKRWDRIGQDHCKSAGITYWKGEKRYLIWAKLKNSRIGYELFFYNTHLSHEANKCAHSGERYRQVRQIIAQINEQQKSGADLPPIVVGDFNFNENRDMRSLNLMNQWFELVAKSSVDRIYVGRQEKFPTKNKFFVDSNMNQIAIQERNISLQNPITIDAAFWGNGLKNRIYLFNGSNYFRFNHFKREVDSYKNNDPEFIQHPGLLSIDRYLNRLPESFKGEYDAALLGNNGYGYFFKGENCLKYNLNENKAVSGYPKKIKDEWNIPAYFHSQLDATLRGLKRWDKDVFFFKDNKYIKIKLSNRTVYSNYPKTIDWGWNFPTNFNNDLDAAFSYKIGSLGFACFIKNKRYVLYSLNSDNTIAENTISSAFENTLWPGIWSDHRAAPSVRLCIQD